MKRIFHLIALTSMLLHFPGAAGAQEDAQARLLSSVVSGNMAEVKAMLEGDPGLIGARNPNGSTPLHLAASGGQQEIAALLIEHGAELDAVNRYGRTPLLYASQNNHLGIVRLLIAKGASVNGSDDYTYTPLHAAANAGQTEVVRYLIDAGADINRIDENGTPLGRAVFSGNLEIVQMLLEAGADINAASPRGWTPMHTAAVGGRLDAARLLIEKGADPDRVDRQGLSPLHLAILGGNRQAEETALLILESGAAFDSEIGVMPGVTPLLVAVQSGMAGLTEAFLARGADYSRTDPSAGRSPLHIAAVRGYGDIVEDLLSAGINVDARDEEGRTALFYAARHGNRRAAQLLVAAGATGAEEENYGPSVYMREGMVKGSAYIWRLADRGWAVRTSGHLFIFNNEEHSRKPDEPLLANGFVSSAEIPDQTILALYTTYHAPAYEKANIHAIEDELEDITYIHFKDIARQGNRNALFIGGRGHIGLKGIGIAYAEEHDVEGMGWLEYCLQSDGVNIYYSGFPGVPPEAHREDLNYFTKHADRCHLAFVLLSATGGESDYDRIDQVISILKPEVVFLHRTSSDMPVDRNTLDVLGQRYPDQRFCTTTDPGERFFFRFR